MQRFLSYRVNNKMGKKINDNSENNTVVTSVCSNNNDSKTFVQRHSAAARETGKLATCSIERVHFCLDLNTPSIMSAQT